MRHNNATNSPNNLNSIDIMKDNGFKIQKMVTSMEKKRQMEQMSKTFTNGDNSAGDQPLSPTLKKKIKVVYSRDESPWSITLQSGKRDAEKFKLSNRSALHDRSKNSRPSKDDETMSPKNIESRNI